MLTDWISDDNVLAFCRMVAIRVGYSFDASDETAVAHGLADTDVENEQWFEYPLVGDRHEVTLRLANDPGSTVVSVAIDPEIEADYCQALVDVMQLYRLVRD